MNVLKVVKVSSLYHVLLEKFIVVLGVKELDFEQEVDGSIPSVGPYCLFEEAIEL